MIYSKGKIHMQANKKNTTTKPLLIMYIYGASVGVFFGNNQFLIDKPSITFLIAFHTVF